MSPSRGRTGRRRNRAKQQRRCNGESQDDAGCAGAGNSFTRITDYSVDAPIGISGCETSYSRYNLAEISAVIRTDAVMGG